MSENEDDYVFSEKLREALNKWPDDMPMSELISNPDFINDVMFSSGLSVVEVQDMWNAVGRPDLANEFNQV